MATAGTQRILLGRIAGAHGVRGEVLIKSYAAAPEQIGAYGPLQDASGTRSFEIAVLRRSTKGVVARITGVDSRTEAEALKGTDLYVERSRLPPPAHDEYYHADLIGLAAVDESGAILGEVVNVHDYGAGPILEVRMARRTTTELVPFTDASVPQVDLAAGRLVVVLPEQT
ncbi:MAG TPA: ribosome maturation factor RimM [Hyphomicrobiaceae bacterium]|nr:ribosome maturation factor RimM [Hyphomicrobiaceae bacterium]